MCFTRYVAALTILFFATVVSAADGVTRSVSPGHPAPLPKEMLQVAGMEGASNCVALTFDDGPDEILTPKLLDLLEREAVAATFFVVGERAQGWPGIVERANHDGYEIGNHSWSHPVLPQLSSDSVHTQIVRTDQVVASIIGHRPAYIRAPYGSISERVGNIDRRVFVGWTEDTLDWLYHSVTHVTNAALRARGGSIVLMHDIHATTIASVPGIIKGLRAKGLRFVTVSQLLDGMCGGVPLNFEIVAE